MIAEFKERKLNRRVALDQAKRGMSNADIARAQHVDHSTVWRFMQRQAPERKALDQFKTHRADVLAMMQAKSLDIQEQLIDSFQNGVIATLTPSQKSSLLIALNAQHGTSYDKERLERNLSTSNQSVMSQILNATVTNLYKPQPVLLPRKSRKQASKQADA